MVLLCNQSVGKGEAVDGLLDGLAEAQLKGQWEPLDAGESRRRALLPSTPAPRWRDLMASPAYIHALGLIP
jgi:beta-N-acetylhexosaminidase